MATATRKRTAAATTSPGTGKVLRLLKPERQVSWDTIRMLRELLEDAERGEIQGMCWVAQKSDGEITYNLCGEAYRNATLAAGMAATLMHGTMKFVFKEDV